jgi:4-amino-4-deoxychorismate lyase
MFPFFETIRYKDALAENLFYHQQRVERTFMHFGEICHLDITRIDLKSEAEKKGAINNAVYKCKIMYDLKGNIKISFEPYQIRAIKTFTIVDIGSNEYSSKFTNRTWINDAVKTVASDEVIFAKDGVLKDASYANIVLYDGFSWITPKSPLLLGTKRASLLDAQQIIEQDILAEQLGNFKKLKFINAMMHMDESPCIDL